MGSSAKFRWMSAADTCQIWDGDNLEVVHKFDDVKGNVGDAAWSADGKSIAFVQKSNGNILTASVTSQQIYQGTTTLTEGEAATALGFANDTLVAGTSSGSILLWDQYKHKLIRKLTGTEKKAVSKIQTNNSVIAAGHSGGNITVYGIKTGQATGQYSISNSGDLRDLRISSVKSSLIAASFNSGTVAAWNTHSKTNNPLIFESAGAHQSPATCVALSPITDILMVSGGLDKCILLYDLPKKKMLKRIEADAPITAIDFFPDGTSLIVGTNRGKILIYDLRSITTPIQTIAAHSSSVTKIICRPHQPGKLDNGNVKKASAKPVTASESSASKNGPQLSAGEQSDKSSHFPFRTRESQLELQFAGGPSPIAPISEGDSNRIPEFPPTMDPASAAKEMDRRNSSLFSPLKGETSEVAFSSPSLAASPFLRYNKARTQEEIRPPINIDTEEESVIMPSSAAPRHTEASPFTPCNPVEESEPQSGASAAPGVSSSQASGAPFDFQAEFIRRIVHDVEDNLREVLRCRFGDLIIQSAQQFLTLQTEIEQLKQQVQDKSYLEEEVRRLRHEVNQLRNLY